MRCDQLPLGTTLGNNITGYKWKIDTKYYNAEAYICPVDVNDNMPNDILQMVEALVIYFDAEQVNIICILFYIQLSERTCSAYFAHSVFQFLFVKTNVLFRS